MYKKLTIIVPTLNEENTIQEILTPLQPLREQGVELLLCDGGSSDNTAVIGQLLVDQLWCSDPGRARQMNAGAMIATGNYLLFLHADTCLPDNFEQIWEDLQRKAPQWGFFSVCLSGRQPLLRMVAFFMNIRSRFTAIATGDQCLWVRRELFEQLGGFADIPLMEDIEICKRLRKHCRPHFISHPVVTSSRRWEKRGVWRTILLMWRLRLAYFLGARPERLARRYYS